MDLEISITGDASHKGKDKYHMLSLMISHMISI